MAIETNTEQVQLKKVRRTWRVNIETADGQQPVLTAHRELVRRTVPDNEVISRDQNAGVVTRSLPNVLTDAVTLQSGTVITVPQLAEAIAAFIDKWENEDNTAE